MESGKSIRIIMSAFLIGVFVLSMMTINLSNTVKAQSPEEQLWNWLNSQKCLCHGGTLRVTLPSEPNTLNWWVAGSDWSILAVAPIYDHPLRFVNGTLVHELVTDYSWSNNHTVLTLKVRKGVQWHDGKPMTAEDIAFTINVLAHDAWTYYHGYYTHVDHAEAVDNYTVKVYFKSPDAGFIYNALTSMNVMPEHIWKPIIDKYGNKTVTYMPKVPDDLVGTGPFKIVKYVPSQYIEYVANKNYWIKGRPCIDKLIVNFITESSTALLAIEKGDTDIYDGWVTAESVPTLLSYPGVAIQVYVGAYGVYYWGFLNNEPLPNGKFKPHYPFNISTFRRALAFAVNKTEIVQDLLQGYGVPASPGLVPPGIGNLGKYYNPNVANAYYFDLNMTAKLLDQLGFKDYDHDGWRDYPNGTHFSFEIYPPAYDIVRVRAAQKIKEWLSEVPGGGVKVIVRVLDWKTTWPLIYHGKVDSWLLGSGLGVDITGIYRRLHSWPQGTGNWQRYSNPEMDKLLDQLLQAFDEQTRKELAWKIQEIVAHDVPMVPLYHRKYIRPYRTDKFDGFFLPSDASIYNRFTLLAVHLKASKCPTLPTSVTTKTVTSVVTSTYKTTVTYTTTYMTTTTYEKTMTTTLPSGKTTTIVKTYTSTSPVTKVVTSVGTTTVTKPVTSTFTSAVTTTKTVTTATKTGISAAEATAIAIIIAIIVGAIAYALARRK